MLVMGDPLSSRTDTAFNLIYSSSYINQIVQDSSGLRYIVGYIIGSGNKKQGLIASSNSGLSCESPPIPTSIASYNYNFALIAGDHPTPTFQTNQTNVVVTIVSNPVGITLQKPSSTACSSQVSVSIIPPPSASYSLSYSCTVGV